jgi:hypothetical protein
MEHNWQARWGKYCDPKNWHISANVFPMLEHGELDALSLDIKSNGLLNPIVRCGGKILDGRNRILACRLANVEPRFKDITPVEAQTFTMSQNCYRRHLKPVEESFAIHALETLANQKTVVRGKVRQRAYKQLSKVKKDLNRVLREIKSGTLPVDLLTERLEKLVSKKGKRGQPVSIFEDLSKRLNALVPTLSDGTEHSFVDLLDNVTDAVISGQFEEKDKPFVGEAVSLLETVSRDFAAYAAEIRKGIAGQ